MNITDILEVKANPDIPAISPGDTVKVRQKVKEGDKTRIQVFQGVVIRLHQAGAGTSFTVRRVSSGIGVERTFPIYSPMIDGVEVVRHGKVRRAKLYYLRGLSARASRIKERRVEKKIEEAKPVEEAAVEATPVDAVPVDTVPVETAPVETASVETAPVENAPVEVQAEEKQAVEGQAETTESETK